MLQTRAEFNNEPGHSSSMMLLFEETALFYRQTELIPELITKKQCQFSGYKKWQCFRNKETRQQQSHKNEQHRTGSIPWRVVHDCKTLQMNIFTSNNWEQQRPYRQWKGKLGTKWRNQDETRRPGFCIGNGIGCQWSFFMFQREWESVGVLRWYSTMAQLWPMMAPIVASFSSFNLSLIELTAIVFKGSHFRKFSRKHPVSPTPLLCWVSFRFL